MQQQVSEESAALDGLVTVADTDADIAADGPARSRRQLFLAGLQWAGAASRLGCLASLVGQARAAGGEIAQPGTTGTPASPRSPALLLAKVAPVDVDVTRYLVSEKLDGVRALWDGQTLRFRSGAPVLAPDWFVAALPKAALDGELWLARSRFDALSALLRRQKTEHEPLWRQVRYVVFEAPNGPGTFAQRAAALRVLVAERAWPGLLVAEQRTVQDRAALDGWLATVIQAGGEGLMLHQADAVYATGRSDVLLKLKPQLDDDAVVIGFLPGKGRHAGRVGALQVRNREGQIFALGSGLPDTLRDSPPPLGAAVEFRYRGLTGNGLPRFATFWRVRDSH